MSTLKFSRDGAIAILLLGLFFLILSIISLESRETISDELSDTQFEENDKGDVKALDLVNKHMRDVFDKQEILRKNTENMNTLTAPPIYKSPRNEPVYNFDDIPLSFDPDSMNELVGKDLSAFEIESSSDRTLSEQIQNEVINDMVEAEELKIEKRNLAESIIEKARQKGFVIEIDENYKVRSVKKIAPDNKKSIFDPNNLPNR